ncbi:MAG: Apre_1838 family putative sactipeptide bacteriocin [Sarcina sp.]
MKLINPFGREVSNLAEGVNPRGCYCSSGAYSMKYAIDTCYLCGCQCDHGPTNRDANNKVANFKGAR